MLQYLVTVSEEVATRLYQDWYLLDVIEKSITVSSEFPLLRYVLILWQWIFSYESIWKSAGEEGLAIKFYEILLDRNSETEMVKKAIPSDIWSTMVELIG